MQFYVEPCHMVSAETPVAMAVPIENPADFEVRGVIRFLKADEVLDYLAEETSSRVELFCCKTMHDRILPGRHKPRCVRNFIWHFRASSVQSGSGTVGLFLFPKMKEHLAGKRFANGGIGPWLNSQAATWFDEGIHKLCQGMTSALMSKATMWKSRERYVPQLEYSVSVLLLKNIFVWRNILYFLNCFRVLE